MDAAILKSKLLEKFSPFAISQTVYLQTRRTTNIDELTEQELNDIYKIFFPNQPSLMQKVVQAEHNELIRSHRSICLTIATRIGLKDPDSWDNFNNWMLNSSILKKRLNDYTLVELQSLERQLRSAESNFQASAEKPGNKAWYQKNGFPVPSKN